MNQLQVLVQAAEDHLQSLVSDSYHGKDDIDEQIFNIGTKLGYSSSSLHEAINSGELEQPETRAPLSIESLLSETDNVIQAWESAYVETVGPVVVELKKIVDNIRSDKISL